MADVEEVPIECFIGCVNVKTTSVLISNDLIQINFNDNSIGTIKKANGYCFKLKIKDHVKSVLCCTVAEVPFDVQQVVGHYLFIQPKSNRLVGLKSLFLRQFNPNGNDQNIRYISIKLPPRANMLTMVLWLARCEDIKTIDAFEAVTRLLSIKSNSLSSESKCDLDSSPSPRKTINNRGNVQQEDESSEISSEEEEEEQVKPSTSAETNGLFKKVVQNIEQEDESSDSSSKEELPVKPSTSGTVNGMVKKVVQNAEQEEETSDSSSEEESPVKPSTTGGANGMVKKAVTDSSSDSSSSTSDDDVPTSTTKVVPNKQALTKKVSSDDSSSSEDPVDKKPVAVLPKKHAEESSSSSSSSDGEGGDCKSVKEVPFKKQVIKRPVVEIRNSTEEEEDVKPDLKRIKVEKIETEVTTNLPLNDTICKVESVPQEDTPRDIDYRVEKYPYKLRLQSNYVYFDTIECYYKEIGFSESFITFNITRVEGIDCNIYFQVRHVGVVKWIDFSRDVPLVTLVTILRMGAHIFTSHLARVYPDLNRFFIEHGGTAVNSRFIRIMTSEPVTSPPNLLDVRINQSSFHAIEESLNKSDRTRNRIFGKPHRLNELLLQFRNN